MRIRIFDSNDQEIVAGDIISFTFIPGQDLQLHYHLMRVSYPRPGALDDLPESGQIEHKFPSER